MRSQSAKRSIRKKPFLLLEVLTCITLVVMVLGPLIATTFNLRKQDIARIRRFSTERDARRLFAGLKERLYANRISWDDLNIGWSEILQEGPLVAHCNIVPLDHCEKPSMQTDYLVIECEMKLVDTRTKNEQFFCFPLLIERKVNA